MNSKLQTIGLLLVISIIFAFCFQSTKDINISAPKQTDSKKKIKNKDNVIVSADRKTVFLDLEQSDFNVGDKYGRVIIELFDDVVPKTAENFYQLCKKNRYAGVPFHRVITNFMVQGGDIDNHDGSGGKSIYGESFPDENFLMKHTEAGLVSMANSGQDTNGSQFFFTLAPQPHLNNKHVVFGRVTQGMQYINDIGNIPTDMSDRPLQDVIIKRAGIMN